MAIALDKLDVGAVLNGIKISNLRFADDIAATAESKTNLQRMVSSITKESGAMGMVINTEETETQHIGPEKKEVKIHINEHDLRQVENFVYLGGFVHLLEWFLYGTSAPYGY